MDKFFFCNCDVLWKDGGDGGIISFFNLILEAGKDIHWATGMAAIWEGSIPLFAVVRGSIKTGYKMLFKVWTTKKF